MPWQTSKAAVRRAAEWAFSHPPITAGMLLIGAVLIGVIVARLGDRVDTLEITAAANKAAVREGRIAIREACELLNDKIEESQSGAAADESKVFIAVIIRIMTPEERAALAKARRTGGPRALTAADCSPEALRRRATGVTGPTGVRGPTGPVGAPGPTGTTGARSRSSRSRSLPRRGATDR
jgi:hypothetical protein